MTHPPMISDWRAIVGEGQFSCLTCGKQGPLNEGYSTCCDTRLMPAYCYESATPSWEELRLRLFKLRSDLDAAQVELDALGVILRSALKASVL